MYATKTRAWRWVPLSPAFVARLRAKQRETQRRHPDCEWICHLDGRQIDDLWKPWCSALKRAKITRRVRMYDIRHFFATYALAAGMDIMELAYILGHNSAQMIVRVYAHRAKELKERQQVQLPDIYGQAPGKAAAERA